MTPNKQVSPAIRILRGERDASARATHLEAATRKFLVTTNERKYMSTKTNFKRIALVAVAALGLGVLSSVPSQATPSAITIDVVDGTATTVLSDSTSAASVTIKGLIGVSATDSISVLVSKKSAPATASSVLMPILTYEDTVSGGVTGNIRKANGSSAASSWSEATTGVDSATTTSPLHITAGGANIFNGFTALLYIDTASLTVASRANTALVSGTYVYTIIATPLTCAATGGCTAGVAVTKDVSIVVSKTAAESDTASGSYGFAFVSSATTTRTSEVAARVDSVLSVLATAGTTRAYLYTGVRNAANAVTVAKDSLTATVTGAGLVCIDTGATCGKSIKVAATGDYEFELQGDGTGGISTITVSASVSGASYTKQVTYYAAAAKTLTATVFTPLLAIGANDSALSVVAVDAAGATWGGQAYIVASTAADATAVGGSATTPVACTFIASRAAHWCPITAAAVGTGKFKVIDAATVALATATSNEVTVTSSNSLPATIKISFSKATYAPGEVGLIIVTPLDAAGKGLPATSISSALASGGISSNVGLSYAATALDMTSTTVATSAYSSTTLVAGSKTFVFTAPTAGGTITLTAKGGAGLPVAGQVAITASAAVTDNAAAALAAVTALATTVASLKTLITTLTNLVLKIQKKVKA